MTIDRENKKSANPGPKNSRILVIDDTRAIHDDFRKILLGGEETSEALDEAESALFGKPSNPLPRHEFILDSAYQGSEGFSLVQQALEKGQPYAMAFIDVRMPPGWDGIETTQKIWEIDPDLQIVICTAYSDCSWDDMIARIGNSDRLVILKKPFDTVEVLQLANALTEKWSLLQQTRKKMGELEQLVAERTRHLEETNATLEAEIAQRKRREEHLALQSDVTCILADSNATTAEIITRILQLICRELHWDTGALWLLDAQSKILRWSAMWHPPGTEFSILKTANEPALFQQGHGLPGLVWENSQPRWISDLKIEVGDPRGDAALKAGLHSTVAFPLHLRGEILGVAEFHSTKVRPPENDLLQIFTTLGSLMGQSIERKKLEDQLRHSQKMDAIGCLAGGVAHDFNNILTVIQGYAQIVEMKGNLDPDTVEGLTQITQATQRATSLTRQLLTFSRKQVMQFKELNLNKAIENLTKMLQRIIGEDVTLKLDYTPEPTFVQADEDMLSQILMNLAVNARDAMPKGGKLEISTKTIAVQESGVHRHAEAKVGEFICLTVKDTGCGVAPENLSHIFEPFFTTKGVGRGTGLGLSTVYGIVRQHNGWIEVASQINSGTAFHIFLPRIAAGKNHETNRTETDNIGGKETILLVEDEGAVRQLARTVLLMHGYKVIEAISGVDALDVWKKHAREIDLLLTDIIMPGGINGRELAQQLKSERPELNIVFMSGYDPDQVGMKSDSKETNFLSKPYSPQKLLKAIRQGLNFDSMAH